MVKKEDHSHEAYQMSEKKTHPNKQVKIDWDDSKLRNAFSNVFNISRASGEIILWFGRKQSEDKNRNEVSVQLSNRIIMSPFTAKRLANRFRDIIQAYESKYGSVNLDPSTSTRSSPSQLDTKKPTFFTQEEINKKASVLFNLVENLKLEGLERSFKMSEKRLLANRFLFGINKKEIKKERLLDICDQMEMPEKYQDALKEKLSDANLFLFGFEENEKSCVYKVYLEFWDKVKREVRTKGKKTDPVLLHLGFKWDALDNTKGTIARYTSYPLLTVKDIMKRLTRIYEDVKGSISFDIVEGIINLASNKTAKDRFIYLEVTEEDNPRRSFDINLYKANLQLHELYPILSKACHHYSIPSEEFDSLYDQISTRLFGHLAGGIDREGKDFLTVYYEVE